MTYRSNKSPMHRSGFNGFTIVELTVVLLLIGIISSVAIVKLTSAKRKSSNLYWANQIYSFNEKVRQEAINQQTSMILVLDLEQQTIHAEKTLKSPTSTTASIASISLPQDHQLTSVWLPPAVEQLPKQIRQVTNGQVAISYSQQGWAADYAFTLSKTDGQEDTWIVTGLTGYLLPIQPAKSISKTLQEYFASESTFNTAI